MKSSLSKPRSAALRRVIGLLALLCGFVLGTAVHPASSEQTDGAQTELVRAAFIAKLPLFIRKKERPEELPAADRTFAVAVFHDEALYRSLEQLSRRPLGEGHTIRVRKIVELKALDEGEILVFPGTARRFLGEVLALVRPMRAIVITDSIALCKKGIMFAVAEEHSRLKLFVNRRAVEEEELVLDYRLAAVARFIDS